MGTSLKTVCFPLPPLASITDATVTNFTQISVQLPEGSKTFKKVWVEAMALDIVTATGGTVGEWRLGLRLGAAGYTTVTQLNDIVHNAENMAPHIAADFTSHFTSNWAAQQSSEVCTCDLQIYIDQTTGTTLGCRSGSAMLWVTYEYDDTSSAMVESIYVPFTSLAGATGTSKPAAQDTIPNLDTMLGYGSISYKHCMVILEGNEAVAGNTTDFALTCQIDTYTAQVGATHESGLASDRYIREHYDMMSGGSPLFTTNATHSIYLWTSTGAVGRMNHAALGMWVVFTFDATSNNNGCRHVRVPFSIDSPSGYTTSSDYQKSLTTELWIEEPTTIAIQKSACHLEYSESAALSGMQFRCGTQSFVAYTDTAAQVCGGVALQRTCDDNISLARGKNTLTCDIYGTSASQFAYWMGGYWVINYKCGKPSGGWGQANRTVVWPLLMYGTGAAISTVVIAATAPAIPETNYFLSSVGVWEQIMGTSTVQGYWHQNQVERLSAEGGVRWEMVISDPVGNDPVPGLWQIFSGRALAYFKRYPTDPDATRFDIETSRRWRIYVTGRSNATFCQSILMFTYHSISWSVTRAITGSGGGTVNIDIHRDSDDAFLYATSRVGDGNYTFVSYDTAYPVHADAYEDGTHLGRSDSFTAS